MHIDDIKSEKMYRNFRDELYFLNKARLLEKRLFKILENILRIEIIQSYHIINS